MNAGGRADVYDLRFSYGAIRNDSEIPPSGQNVCRAPIHLDDASIHSSFEIDPIAGPIGPAEVQHKAGKQVAQRALKGEAENDGDAARGRKQTLDGQIEDIGDDGEDSGEINEPGKE